MNRPPGQDYRFPFGVYPPGYPLADPPRYAEPVDARDGVRGWQEGTEARDDSPKYPGDGQSRTVDESGSGVTLRLCQSTMFQDGGLYTCVFDVKADPSTIYRAVATIRWSENGNTVQRVMDIVRGAQITVPGRTLDVSVTDMTPENLPLITGEGGDPVPNPTLGDPYTITMLVERGNRAAEGRPPTLYGGSAILTTHTSETVDIPSQCGVISLEVSAVEDAAFPTAKPNILVTFTTASGGIFKAYDPTVETGFVTIPPGATQVEITNADGSNSAIVTLNWGVDG